MMVYRTRQRTKLAATREKGLSPSQVKASEDNASDKDLAKESSSEESEGEVVEKEQSDEDEPIQWKQQQSDCELDALPDILNLESCDELIRADTMSSQQKRPSTEVGELCCSLDHRTNVAGQLYFSFDVESVVRGHSSRAQPLCQGGHDPHHKLMKKSIITPDFEKRDSVPPISQSRYTMEKTKKAKREKSTGGKWFDMPAPQLTDELKNDLRLLKMRNALDPTRHYKSSDSKTLPRYFQVGRVVSGPADFYSSRLQGKQKKATLLDELLAGEESRRYHKKKYLELQHKFMSGTRRHRSIKHKKKYRTFN